MKFAQIITSQTYLPIYVTQTEVEVGVGSACGKCPIALAGNRALALQGIPGYVEVFSDRIDLMMPNGFYDDDKSVPKYDIAARGINPFAKFVNDYDDWREGATTNKPLPFSGSVWLTGIAHPSFRR